VGLTAVGRWLASLETPPQKPLRRAYERDPEAVAQWVRKDYPRLRRRAGAVGATIFFLDEAGFSSEPALGRTDGLRGQTPVVATTGQRQKVSAMSAVSACGGFWSTVDTGLLNATRLVEFLGDFRRDRREKIFLVVDGHPSHKAKLVKDSVQSCRGKLELHFLPPYAPDLNPDEFVWQHAKTHGVAKKPLRQNESLKARVTQDLATIKSDKPLVRSFFMSHSVVYARGWSVCRYPKIDADREEDERPPLHGNEKESVVVAKRVLLSGLLIHDDLICRAAEKGSERVASRSRNESGEKVRPAVSRVVACWCKSV
jgi:transposase